ncbi:MAG: hypothetical protein AAF251_05785 [Pseudomonadota bacterium]
MGWVSLVSGVLALVALVLLLALLPESGQWALGLSFVSALVSVVTGFFARRQSPSIPAKAGLTLGVTALVLNVLLLMYLTSSNVQSDGPVAQDGGDLDQPGQEQGSQS